jgi:uncharacterized membrane protein YidH (DUF202 family)
VSGFDAESRDPGLAAERTDLAWNRSNLSLLACGAIIMRGIARPPLTTGNVAVGLAILALGASTWILGAWRVHRSRARGARRTAPADLLPISLGVAVVGAAAFVVAAFFPS